MVILVAKSRYKKFIEGGWVWSCFEVYCDGFDIYVMKKICEFISWILSEIFLIHEMNLYIWVTETNFAINIFRIIYLSYIFHKQRPLKHLFSYFTLCEFLPFFRYRSKNYFWKKQLHKKLKCLTINNSFIVCFYFIWYKTWKE